MFSSSGSVVNLASRLDFAVATSVMTVQDDTASKAMPQTASTRSRFMITDILSGGGGNGPPGSGPRNPETILRNSESVLSSVRNDANGARSPSPGPRDLSLHASQGLHHQLHHHHPDSDTDSSGHPDTGSVCSNGEFFDGFQEFQDFFLTSLY